MQTPITYTGTRSWSSNGVPGSGTWPPTIASVMAMNSGNATTSGTAVVKFVYNKDNAADKPLSKVWVVLSASASWSGTDDSPFGMPSNVSFSGSANNGLGSPVQPIFADSKIMGGESSGVKTYVKSSPGDYDRDSATPTITMPALSMSANMSGSGTTGAMTMIARCSLTGKVVDPHNHPINMRMYSSPTVTPAGTLHFIYIWDAGIEGTVTKAWNTNNPPLAPELNACTMREYVTYSGNGSIVTVAGKNYFQPPNPPFTFAPLEFPTVIPFSAVGGSLVDDHDNGLGGSPTFSHPYSNSAFTGTQYYQFHCTTCMDDGEWETLRGPLLIDRSIHLDDPGWWFIISKEGYSSYLQISNTSNP